jgi:hypothetical protein
LYLTPRFADYGCVPLSARLTGLLFSESFLLTFLCLLISAGFWLFVFLLDEFLLGLLLHLPIIINLKLVDKGEGSKSQLRLELCIVFKGSVQFSLKL